MSRVDHRHDEAAEQALAAYSPTLFHFFTRYLHRYFARNFNAMRVLSPGVPEFPQNRPVVFFANHAGWWDPILYLFLAAKATPGRRGFGPIDDKALKKYAFLRRIGIFGIEQDTMRGAARFLAISRRLLAERDTTLWITPQGRFADPRERPVRFKPGLAHIARDVEDAVLVPLAVEYPFWMERFPEVLVHFGPPVDARDHGPLSAEGWNALLERRLEEAMDQLAAAAIARDPEAFELLLSGDARVSLAYDAWRFLKARIRGERFSAAHGDRDR